MSVGGGSAATPGPARPGGGDAGREGVGPAPAGAEQFRMSGAAPSGGEPGLLGTPAPAPETGDRPFVPGSADDPAVAAQLDEVARQRDQRIDEERQVLEERAAAGEDPFRDVEIGAVEPPAAEPPLRVDEHGAADGPGAFDHIGLGDDQGRDDLHAATDTDDGDDQTVDAGAAAEPGDTKDKPKGMLWWRSDRKAAREARRENSTAVRNEDRAAEAARKLAEKAAEAARKATVEGEVAAREQQEKTAAEKAAELTRALTAVDLVVEGSAGGGLDAVPPEMRVAAGEAVRALFKRINPDAYAVVEGEDYKVVNPKDLRSDYVGSDVREKVAQRQTEAAKLAAEQQKLRELQESYKVVVSGNDIFLVSDAQGVTIGPDGSFVMGEYEKEVQVMDYNPETGENDLPRFDDDDNPVMRTVSGKGHADISIVSFTPRESKDARGKVYDTYHTASVVSADGEGRLASGDKGKVDRSKPEELEALFAEAAASPVELKLNQWNGIDIVDIGTEPADQAKATNRRILDTDRYMDDHEDQRGLIIGAGAEAVRRGLIHIDSVDRDLQWLGPEKKGPEGTLQLVLSDDQMDQYNLLTTAQQRAFVRGLGLPTGYNLDKRGVNPVASADADPEDDTALRVQAGESGKGPRRELSGKAADNLRSSKDLLALSRDQDDDARKVVEAAHADADLYTTLLVVAAQRGKDGYTDPYDVMQSANDALAGIRSELAEKTKGIAGDVSRLDIARDIIAEKLGVEGDRLEAGALPDQFAERLAETIGKRSQVQEFNHILALSRQTVDGKPEAYDAWTGRMKDQLRALGVDRVDQIVDAIHQPEVVAADSRDVISGIARDVMTAHSSGEDPRALRDRLLADIQSQEAAGTLTGEDLVEARRAVDEFAPEPVAPPSQTELFGSTMRRVMGAASAEEAFAILSGVEGQLDPADAAIVRGQVDAKRPPVQEQPDQALVDAAVNLLARQLGISEEAARAMLSRQAAGTTTSGT